MLTNGLFRVYDVQVAILTSSVPYFLYDCQFEKVQPNGSSINHKLLRVIMEIVAQVDELKQITRVAVKFNVLAA